MCFFRLSAAIKKESFYVYFEWAALMADNKKLGEILAQTQDAALDSEVSCIVIQISLLVWFSL